MKIYQIIIKGRDFLFLMPFILVLSCQTDKASNIPDVSDIRVDIDITRFDQLLLADTTVSPAEISQLMQEHPAFSKIYFDHVMPKPDELIINSNDPEVKAQQIISWIRHPRTRWLYDTIQQIYPDLKDVEEDLESALRYAKYHFPEKETPRFY